MTVSRLSDGNSKKVIVVGRYEWQKGYDRLLEIWKLVTRKHPDWQLDIYGEGSLEDELRADIRQAGFTNVSLHPFTPDISQRYAESSLCLLASRFEGFSLVLLEAIRHGVPCVSFDCPYGPSDVIDDGRCGYVVADGDIRQFADRVCYLIEHPEVRESFAAAAIKKAETYNTTTIINQWKTLFSSLTETRRKKSLCQP